MYQSQESGTTCGKSGVDVHPYSHRGDAPARGVIGTAQLVAHEAGDSILCCEGSDALFSNDFGEDLLSSS